MWPSSTCAWPITSRRRSSFASSSPAGTCARRTATRRRTEPWRGRSLVPWTAGGGTSPAGTGRRRACGECLSAQLAAAARGAAARGRRVHQSCRAGVILCSQPFQNLPFSVPRRGGLRRPLAWGCGLLRASCDRLRFVIFHGASISMSSHPPPSTGVSP